MKSQTKFLLLSLAFVVVLVGAVVLYNLLTAKPTAPGTISNGTNGVSTAVGSDVNPEIYLPVYKLEEPVPSVDFIMEDMEGNEATLFATQGKPVVLNFWASWCPPCKEEMPHFNALNTELGDQITFMMVDLVDGGQETRADGEAYIAEQGFTFPVYYDTSQNGAIAYGVSSIPTTLFIDAEGNVVALAQGLLSEAKLRYGISLILDE